MSDAVRTCPACGGSNPAGRELCGHCGVDLFTGAELPRQTRGEAPDPPRRPAEPREHHRWAVPAAAVVFGALLLVGVATWAGFGPFADPTAVSPAAFEPARYPDRTEQLLLSSVAASGAAPDAPASAVTDGDPTTAWRSASSPPASEDPDGPFAVLAFELDEPGWIERVEVSNGDQQDGEAYADAARIARMRVSTDAGEEVVVDLLDLGLEAQEVELPEPLLATELRVEIVRVFRGAEDGAIALSELELVGWTADPEDAELARERREAFSSRTRTP